jgi:hypothetical protein
LPSSALIKESIEYLMRAIFSDLSLNSVESKLLENATFETKNPPMIDNVKTNFFMALNLIGYSYNTKNYRNKKDK